MLLGFLGIPTALEKTLFVETEFGEKPLLREKGQTNQVLLRAGPTQAHIRRNTVAAWGDSWPGRTGSPFPWGRAGG